MSFLHLLAQAATAATPEAAAQQGVISYPPSFFAAQQPGNAQEMLNRLPGFSIDFGNNQRGFEGAGGNVLIDGQRPTSKTDGLGDVLSRIPASQVERIDLIRGGAPGIDMQGKSVVANVVRKKGAGALQGLIAVANNHTYDGRDLYGVRSELSGNLGERAWELSARFGFGVDDGAGAGAGVHVTPGGTVLRRSLIDSEGDGGNYTVTGAWEQPLAGGRIRLNARNFGDKFKFEQDDTIVFPAPEVQSNDELFRNFDNEIGVRYDRPLLAKLNLELVGLHQTKDREVTSRFTEAAGTSVFQLERESSETIARSVLKYRFNDELQLEAGGEAALNEQDSQTLFTSNGAVVALPAANVTVQEKRGELFAKSIWRPNPKFTVEGGFRYEGSRITSEGDVVLEKTLYFPKPRAALTWSMTDKTQLRLRFERIVGQLNFGDFVASSNFTGVGVTVGNPDIEPEQAWVSEAAIEQRFWKDGVIVVTFRHSELSDVIDRGPVFQTIVDAEGQSTVNVFDTPTNIGSGTKDEIIVGLSLPFDRLGVKGALLKGNLYVRDSKVTDPTTGEKREISFLRPLEWDATFSHDLPQWKMTYGVDVFGAFRQTGYRFNSIDTFKLRTYVRPFAEWRVRPDVQVRIELPNITSRGLRRTRQVFAGPRDENPVPIRIEDREYQFGRMYYIRIRKTFGG